MAPRCCFSALLAAVTSSSPIHKIRSDSVPLSGCRYRPSIGWPSSLSHLCAGPFIFVLPPIGRPEGHRNISLLRDRAFRRSLHTQASSSVLEPLGPPPTLLFQSHAVPSDLSPASSTTLAGSLVPIAGASQPPITSTQLSPSIEQTRAWPQIPPRPSIIRPKDHSEVGFLRLRLA
ncbi:hypothetical protein VUR80DRAFT_9020 [Thermomyces stellatus]